MFKSILFILGCFIHLTSLEAQEDSSRIIQKYLTVYPDSFKVVGKALKGKAGVYSLKAEGKKMANGGFLDNNSFTSACNSFPFDSWIRVTNSQNGKSVLVRVTDRTSKKKSAPIIQLTSIAAAKLGIPATKKTNVKIEQIAVINYLSDTIIQSELVIQKPIVLVLPDTTTTPNTFKTKGKAITGIASFYKANLDGSITATGERYRNKKLTAASNNFKLNTWVLVTNLKNQKSVIVRINDRMHPRMKKKGRVVDMSGDAAAILDYKQAGLAKVKVQEIEFVRESAIIPLTTDSILLIKDSLNMRDSIKEDIPKLYDTDKNTVLGIASFYSINFEGTKTATGEIFRNNKMSAASNHFPLNTWVRVTNLKNNKSIILRVNDRMHPRMKAKGRVVDLSRAAAKKLNFIKSGLLKVKVERVKKGTLN